MDRWVGRLSVVTAALAFVVLLSSLVCGFVSRELLTRGLVWSDELARLSFVWCALFGAAAAWSNDGLHRIDLFVRGLSASRHRLAALFSYALIVFVLLYLVNHGWSMTARAMGQTTSTLQISGAWFYVPLPAAAGLMLVTTLGRVSGLVLTKRGF